MYGWNGAISNKEVYKKVKLDEKFALFQSSIYFWYTRHRLVKIGYEESLVKLDDKIYQETESLKKNYK